MLKLSMRFPNVPLSAALILLAILANPAFASGRKPPKDERPVCMGTVHLPSRHAPTLFAMMPNTPEVAALSADNWPKGQESTLVSGYEWYESSKQQFFDSLLPGVRFLKGHEIGQGGGRMLYYALFQGKRWNPENLNEMLRLSGFQFDSAHMAVAAEAAVLLTHYARKLETGALKRFSVYYLLDRTSYLFPGWSQTDSLAFPAMEITSMSLGAWGDTTLEFPQRGMWVQCQVEGVSESLFVDFWQDAGRPQVYVANVYGPRNSVFYFDQLDTRKAPQGRNELPPRDTLLPPALRDSFPDAVSYAEAPLGPRATGLLAEHMSSLALPLGIGRRPYAIDDSTSWWPVQKHPLLDSLFPGIEVYRCPWTFFGQRHQNSVILYQGTLYRLERLNELILDVGLNEDTCNMPVLARVAAILALLGRRVVASDSVAGLSVQADTWRPALTSEDGLPQFVVLSEKRVAPVGGYTNTPVVRLECLVNHIRCAIDVRFTPPVHERWPMSALLSIEVGGLSVLKYDLASRDRRR